MVSVFGTTAKVERWTGAEFVHSKCMWCVFALPVSTQRSVLVFVVQQLPLFVVVVLFISLSLSLPSSSCLPFVCQQRRFACLQMCLPSFVLSSATTAAS